MNSMPATPPSGSSLGTVAKPAAPQDNPYTRATTDIQVIRMWLHRRSPQTVRAYSNDVKAFFAFVGCTLAEVRLEDVQAFADDIAEELAPSSQKRRLAAVKSLLSFANKIGYIQKDVSPHWLRHAHASHALDRGAPVHLVKDTLGHASLATTSQYAHARPGDSSARYLGV